MEEHLSNLHPMLRDLRIFKDDMRQFRIIQTPIKNQLCLVVHCNDLTESSMTVFGRIETTWKGHTRYIAQLKGFVNPKTNCGQCYKIFLSVIYKFLLIR
jgi:hypothetical protein